MDDEAYAEQAIEEWRGRAGGQEEAADEARKQTQSPAVKPMRVFRRREGRRVVHGVLVDRKPEHVSSSVRHMATGNIGKVRCRTVCCFVCV